MTITGTEWHLLLRHDAAVLQASPNVFAVGWIDVDALVEGERTLTTLLHASDRPRFLELLAAALECTIPVSGDAPLRMEGPGGETIWVRLSLYAGAPLQSGQCWCTMRDVTETMRLQSIVTSREHLLTMFADAVVDLLWTADLTGNYTYVSPSVDRMTGFTRQECLHRSLWDAMAEEDRARGMRMVENAVAAVRHTGRSAPIMLTQMQRRKDGRTIWTESVINIVSHGTEPEGLAGVTHDVTERMMMSQALEANEREYKNLFTRMSSGFAVHEMLFDAEGNAFDYRYLMVNPAFERMTGLRQSDVTGRTARELFPDIGREWIERYADVARTGVEHHFEEYFHPLHRYFDVQVYRVSRHMIGVLLNDVTERRRLAADVELQSANLRAILDSTDDLVALYDRDDRLVAFNAAFEKTMREFVDTEITPGLFLLDHLGEEERARWEPLVLRVLSGERVTEELRYGIGGHEVTLEVTLFPVCARGIVTGYTEFTRNVTPLKHAERALIEARDTAERAVRLKEMFIATLSHEIRTPLNIILGYLSLIGDAIDRVRPGIYDDTFRSIDNAASRLMRTIDLTLSLSRVTTGDIVLHCTRIPLHGLLDRLIREHTLCARERGITLELIDMVPDLRITADEMCMEQVFSNLIGNAVKYTKEGSVRVELLRTVEGRIEVRIIDTGIGMHPEYLPQIFDLYSQEDTGYTRSYEGIGLGLALVKRYLDLHGVPISVESTKDVGTTFTLDLTPLVHPPA